MLAGMDPKVASYGIDPKMLQEMDPEMLQSMGINPKIMSGLDPTMLEIWARSKRC